MINKNKLFDLFGLSTDQESLLEKTEYNIDFLKIKMFIKLVEGSDTFKSSMKKINQDISDRYDGLSDNLIFIRALFYVETIDVDNLQSIPELTELLKRQFIKSLQKSIKYFEGAEQYEVCAFLFNIEKTLKDLK